MLVASILCLACSLWLVASITSVGTSTLGSDDLAHPTTMTLVLLIPNGLAYAAALYIVPTHEILSIRHSASLAVVDASPALIDVAAGSFPNRVHGAVCVCKTTRRHLPRLQLLGQSSQQKFGCAVPLRAANILFRALVSVLFVPAVAFRAVLKVAGDEPCPKMEARYLLLCERTVLTLSGWFITSRCQTFVVRCNSERGFS